MPDLPDQHTLGTVPDIEDIRRQVRRDHDCLDVSRLVTCLPPSGVRELETLITAYWTGLARWRAARLDLAVSGIDLDACRESLATLAGTGDPADFTAVDWHEVGVRLASLRQYGGYGYDELTRLHELLTSDNPETTVKQ